MPSGRKAYRGGTLVLSVVMLLVGAVLLVSTIARGGGALAVGVVFGLLFLAAGGARLYLLRRS